MVFDVKIMRNNIIFELDEFNSGLAKIVRDKECFVSCIRFSVKEDVEGKVFKFYDFTCKEEDHKEDLLKYSTFFYDQFEGTNHSYLSV